MTPVSATAAGYPILLFPTSRAWTSWLEEHHADTPGVWMRIAKKGAALTSVTYAEALDGALCYGWIDGQKRSHDDVSWLQKFTPRGKRSVWSQINRGHVARLVASGAMRPPGQAAVDAARADGRWDRAYASPKDATMHPDFAAALAAHPAARTMFDTLTGTNRYGILYRIQTAVKPETRAKRIREFVAMLERGEVLFEPRSD